MYTTIKLAVIKLIDLSSSRWYDPIDQIVTDHKSFLKVLSSFQWVELQCRDDFHVWLFEQWLCPCVRFLVLPGLGKLKVVVPCTHEMYVCAHRVLLIIFHKGIGVKLVSRTLRVTREVEILQTFLWSIRFSLVFYRLFILILVCEVLMTFSPKKFAE